MRLDVKWVFFDVGSTLVDETEAYSHRIRDVIKGTNVTFEQFQEKRMFFAKQNLKGKYLILHLKWQTVLQRME